MFLAAFVTPGFEDEHGGLTGGLLVLSGQKSCRLGAFFALSSILISRTEMRCKPTPCRQLFQNHFSPVHNWVVGDFEAAKGRPRALSFSGL